MSRLNVGILGCGAIAATMANTVRKTKGFCMYAAASRNLDKATGFAKRNGVRKAYGSYEELLQDKKVDLVYIATPHSEHFEHAKLCISYGKPCLVEKAFTVNEAQAREVFRLAKEKNVFITEAIWTRYMPFVRTMKEVLASGVIGKPVFLSANLGYDVKGKKYIDTPVKYYFTDMGLRNARLNFRQIEETHSMENIIFNELKIRGFNVDVGVIIQHDTDKNGNHIRKQLEIDFVCNQGSKRYYIQSAYAIPDQDKMEQEQRSLMLTGDFFKRLIITKDTPVPYYNESGVLIMSVYDFLLNENSLEF